MPLDPIEIITIVERVPADVFDAFVSRMSEWWPLESHSVGPYLGEPAPKEIMVERREGGRICELSISGEQRLWGVFNAYEFGKKLSFSWHPGLDSELATFVTVTFQATDDGKTVVTLIHSGWDAREDNAKSIRENYVSGWDDIIKSRFATYVKKQYVVE